MIQIQHDLEDEKFLENLTSFNVLDPKSYTVIEFYHKVEKKKENNKTHTWAGEFFFHFVIYTRKFISQMTLEQQVKL